MHDDPTAEADATAWTLKMDRAAHHIEDLRRRIEDYLGRSPYRLEHERGPGELRLRLHVNEPPPSELSTVVGDALHNLRSALDTRVVAIAHVLAGRRLSDDEERPLALPITPTASRFRDDTARWTKALGPELADALRTVVLPVQPHGPPSGRWAAHMPGVVADDTARFHRNMTRRLSRLGDLSNIDKHRRLHLTWWSFNRLGTWGEFESYRYVVGDPPWRDGQVIARMIHGPDEDDVAGELIAGLTLVLPGALVAYDFNAADDLDNIRDFVGDALAVIDFEAGQASS